MNIVAKQVGIDVSLERLDISIGGAKTFSCPNDQEGCKELAAKLPKGAQVHLESTGGHERLVRRTLQARGFVVKVHNPLRVRRSAQGDGINAKTDSIDARHLANRGYQIKDERVKSQETEDLCDLSRGIDRLKRCSSNLKVMAQKPQCDSYTRDSFLQTAREIDLKVKDMQREYQRRIKNTELADRFELAQSIPCVGPNLARVVTCELPDKLEDYTDAQLGAYSSTAPMDNSSGKKVKAARIKAANMRIKAALYMPALVSIRRQQWAKDLYARLRAKGKPHLQAIVAVMHRLFMRIVLVLKRGSAWEAEPPKA